MVTSLEPVYHAPGQGTSTFTAGRTVFACDALGHWLLVIGH
jgi:hypothetical protein